MKGFLKTIFATAFGTLIGGLFLLFFLSAIIGLMVYGSRQAQQYVAEGSILQLQLSGELTERFEPFELEYILGAPILGHDFRVGLFELIHAIDGAKNDSRIKGIYIEIDNFEGGWAGLSALRRALLDFKESQKFIYVYSEVYDEKMLYLASVADQIFLQPNGDVEFNGLSVTPAFIKGLLAKLGIQPRIFRVGKFKSAIEPLVMDEMSDENKRQYQMLLGDFWNEARSQLSEKVKMSPEELDQLAEKMVVAPAKGAVDSGLPFTLAYEHDVLEMLRDATGVASLEELSLVPHRGYLSALGLDGRKVMAGNKIAVVFADGEIMGGRSRDGFVGSDTIVEALRAITRDPNVKAVVLRVNSPGGSSLAADVIWAQVKALNEKKPVIASFGDVAASGGYYIAAPARLIYSEPNTITGSIGVFGVLVNTQSFFNNKLGVKFDRVVTNPYADLGNPNRPMTEYEAGKIQTAVEKTYHQFVSIVEEGRKSLTRPMSEIAEGRIWSGTRAKDIGLVDEIGGLKAAVEKAAELAGVQESYMIETYPKPEDPFSRLAQGFFMSAERILARYDSKMLELLKEFRKVEQMESGVYALWPTELDIH